MLLDQCSRPVPADPDSYIAPDAEEVEKVDELLKNILNQRDLDIGRYKRQYGGYLRNSERFLYVNGLIELGDSSAWRSNVVFACDGGENFFGAELTLTTIEWSILSLMARREADTSVKEIL